MKKIQSLFWMIITQVIYRVQFNSIGRKSRIVKPMKLDNKKSIYIGDRVYVGHFGWLMGGTRDNVTLKIGTGSVIGHFVHIIAVQSVEIGSKVLFADKVFISDCTHNFSDTNIPVIDQGISVIKEVSIGDGSWLGENVCVLGASIGKNCVIGANSVVTEDIPDYSVAAGSPARVIRCLK